MVLKSDVATDEGRADWGVLAEFEVDCFKHLKIHFIHQGVANPVRQRPVPLKNVVLNVIVLFLRRSRARLRAWWADRRIRLQGVFKAALQAVENVVVGGLLVEVEHEDFLEAILELLRHHREQLARVVLLQTLPQQVLKVEVLVLENLLEVGPRQRLVVEQIDEHVEGSLDVVSARLVVPAAGVERSEKKVAAELE